MYRVRKHRDMPDIQLSFFGAWVFKWEGKRPRVCLEKPHVIKNWCNYILTCLVDQVIIWYEWNRV